MGTHIPMGLHTLFERPAKYFTVVRHPVDRVVSSFFHLRRSDHIPSYRYIKDMTLEEYLDSGIGLDPFDQQVRMLSGCAELDAPMDPQGRPIVAPKVERRHFEMAKRNVEELFVTAAPIEEFGGVLLFLRSIYGWSLRHIMYRVLNQTPGRPRLDAVSESTQRRLAECNPFDSELYEWVTARFAEQIRALEPEFSRDRRRLQRMNQAADMFARVAPQSLRRAAGKAFFRKPT